MHILASYFGSVICLPAYRIPHSLVATKMVLRKPLLNSPRVLKSQHIVLLTAMRFPGLHDLSFIGCRTYIYNI